jgi:DNA-binding MarR family transcriptional regulator
MEWDLISFITSGSLRFKILAELLNKTYTPSQLSTKLKIPISHISSTLKELSEKSLIECLTPDRRRNKFFQITKKGEKLLDEINKITKKKG